MKAKQYPNCITHEFSFMECLVEFYENKIVLKLYNIWSFFYGMSFEFYGNQIMPILYNVWGFFYGMSFDFYGKCIVPKLYNVWRSFYGVSFEFYENQILPKVYNVWGNFYGMSFEFYGNEFPSKFLYVSNVFLVKIWLFWIALILDYTVVWIVHDNRHFLRAVKSIFPLLLFFFQSLLKFFQFS